MTAPVTVRERDLRALAGIVSEDRPDVPDGEGLPLSLLAELMGQIRCDTIAFQGFDCQRQKTWFVQAIPDPDYAWHEENDPVHGQLYWDCQPCRYPDRTEDLRNVVKISDFYSARQWHSVGMYCDTYRPLGFEHDLMLTLPAMPGPAQGPGQPCGCSFSADPTRIFRT